jgi:uncharacterized protein (TIGR03435 family)
MHRTVGQGARPDAGKVDPRRNFSLDFTAQSAPLALVTLRDPLEWMISSGQREGVLKVYRVGSGIGILVICGIGGLHGQSIRRPAFEVASVTAAPGCEMHPINPNPSPSPGRLQMECVTVERLIQSAYMIFANGKDPSPAQEEIAGGPAWIRSDRYDIAAKAEGPATTAQMLGPMMQVLLERRFGLKVHRATRELPVYVLTVSKGGAKLKPSECVAADPKHPPAPPPPGKPLPHFCGNTATRRGATATSIDGEGLTMEEFSYVLGKQLGRTTIDRTGLTGRFDFHLEFLPDDDGGISSAIVAAVPQLGLKLSSEKGPVDYLIVDSVQKPTAN